MNTAELASATELARSCFKLANWVTGIQFAQAALFLHSLGRHPGLRSFIVSEAATARKTMLASGLLYLMAALGCSIGEIVLRVYTDQPAPVISTALVLALGRLLLIAATSIGGVLLLRKVRVE